MTIEEEELDSKPKSDSYSVRELNSNDTFPLQEMQECCKLKSRNNSLNSNDTSSTCFVCVERPADAVLLECGHSGLCVECANVLWDQGRRCPLCRRGFAAIMRIVVCATETVTLFYRLNQVTSALV